MTQPLENQVVLLTGATGGIGREIAILLSQEPIVLLMVARNKGRLKELANELNYSNKATLQLISCDLTDALQVKEMVHKVISDYGRIDHVVHAAGVGDFKPFINFTIHEIDEMIEGNTQSVMYLFSYILPHMIKQQAGKWSVIVSSGGYVATPSSSVYSASKFAIIGLTNALRMELDSKAIQLTTINPGPVDTKFHHRNPHMESYLERVSWMALRPQVVAQRIVDNMKRMKMKKEITLPWFLVLAAKGYALAPRLADWVITHFFNYKEENL